LRDEYFFLPDFLQELLPDSVINKPMPIGGLFLFLGLWGLYYVVFKRILKQDDSISMWYLIVFGGLIALFSEVIYQFYRQFTFDDVANWERMLIFFKGVLALTVFSSIIAFSTAYDLKYKNRWISSVIVFGLLFIYKYAVEYLGLI